MGLAPSVTDARHSLILGVDCEPFDADARIQLKTSPTPPYGGRRSTARAVPAPHVPHPGPYQDGHERETKKVHPWPSVPAAPAPWQAASPPAVRSDLAAPRSRSATVAFMCRG